MNFMTEFNGEKFIVSAFSESKKNKSRFNDKRVFKKIALAEKVVDEYNENLVTKFSDDCKNENIIVSECKDCNSYFTISYDEFKFYTEHDFPLPIRCSHCRKLRKNKNNKDNKGGENNAVNNI